jgi:hypothetical protein
MIRPAHLFSFLAVRICVGAAPTTSPPRVKISIYAPKQKNSPLRITGFRYNDSAIQVVLSNDSNKVVTSFIVVGTLSVPPGCSPTTPQPGETGGGLQDLRIGSKETRTTTKDQSPFSPSSLVIGSKEWQTAYLHVQAGVVEVDFADGTKWRPYEGLPVDPFDRSLDEADAGACSHSDSSSIVEALGRVSKVGFESRTKPVEQDVPKSAEGSAAVPYLVFSCSLNDSMAACPHVD